MANKLTVVRNGTLCDVQISEHRGRYEIELVVADEKSEDYGFPYARASVQVAKELPKGHVGIKDYSENTGMLQLLIDNKIVGEPVGFIPSGFVRIPICPLLVEPNM